MGVVSTSAEFDGEEGEFLGWWITGADRGGREDGLGGLWVWQSGSSQLEWPSRRGAQNRRQ